MEALPKVWHFLEQLLLQFDLTKQYRVAPENHRFLVPKISDGVVNLFLRVPKLPEMRGEMSVFFFFKVHFFCQPSFFSSYLKHIHASFLTGVIFQGCLARVRESSRDQQKGR